jgi:pseudaminic acid synthase
MQAIEIAGRAVGPTHPTLVIAELSANHNHDLAVALQTIDAAAECGADAIKLQTYTADTLTIDSDAEPFQVRGGTAWDGKTLYELYSEASTPWEWHRELFERARSVGLICFSTPFDPTAVDLLESLDTPAYKVASMEIVDTPLIELVASKGKPVIISTGIATLDEISAAVEACRRVGNHQVVLLHCTSGYPTPIGELNLRTITDLRERFDVPIGLSDHTLTHTAAVVSTALGSCVVEKHFILDRGQGGPDSSFSLEPAQFAEMVRQIRAAEEALGTVSYELAPSARVSRSHARSLFVVAEVRAGDEITAQNVRSIRPADGLPPASISAVIGERFARDAAPGTPLSWDLVAPAG